MEKITMAIIGGGASGLILASFIQNAGKTVVFERGDRVGKKLSATGNGQGNVTNTGVRDSDYFSFSENGVRLAKSCIQVFDDSSFAAFLKELGVLLSTDDRGRVYPSGRQASALTDALRFYLDFKGVNVRLSQKITDVKKVKDGFELTVSSPEGEYTVFSENVALCAGGKAAKNFGTDGSAYRLAEKLGHTLTELYPSLVQIKTETQHIKTLKGIRVNGAVVTVRLGKTSKRVQGDVIFTDYGLSGDAIFRLSPFITDKIHSSSVELSIDFLPEFSAQELQTTLENKQKTLPSIAAQELLFGIVNNQIGRAVMKRADGEIKRAVSLIKAFTLPVTGSLGFDYAQVTKGGISMDEVSQTLESKLIKGLYFAGEILDVDGECGGYNLQWAYSSARVVATAINAKCEGQV
ncbi:MAG: aminoacetone oxidase family FAD-binding enzyme [Clostridia bacterium]|nr:aminoacetone oxidase family FAD-binding enzyme [Clostridia bacterium]